MIVQAGRTYVRELIKGDETGGFTHIGYGTGTTAETDADTDLGTSVARISAVVNTAGDRYGEFTAILSTLDAVGVTPSEWGLFTASSGGSMLLRKMKALSSAKTIDDELHIHIKIEVK